MAPPRQAEVSRYLEKLQRECQDKQRSILERGQFATSNELQAEPPEIQTAFLKTVLANVDALAPGGALGGETILGKMFSAMVGPKLTERRLDWLEFRALGNMVSDILRQKLPFQPQDLADMVCSYADNIKHLQYFFSLAPLIGAVEAATRITETEAAMQRLKKSFAHVTSNSKENRRLLERIDHYLDPKRAEQLLAGGPWSSAVFAEILKMAEPERSRWREVFFHCVAAQSSTPSKAWRKRSQELIAAIDASRVESWAVRWLNPDIAPRTANAASYI